MVAARKLAAAAGSYALTGSAATLRRGVTMPAAGGSYALTGTAVSLRSGKGFVAANGSYVLTGTNARYTLNGEHFPGGGRSGPRVTMVVM